MSLYDNLPEHQTNLGGEGNLPFATFNFWWKNGNPQLSALAESDPVSYFGGWVSNEDKYNEAGLIHPDVYDVTWTNKKKEPYNVKAVRFLFAALIDKRKGWFPKDHNDPNSPHRSVTNILVMLAVSQPDKTLTKLGPAVLSGKVYSGKEIENSFLKWEQASAKIRMEHAGNASPWFFYIPVGTLGANILTKTDESKSGEVYTITPCHTSEKLLKSLTPEILDRYFVGRDVIDEMLTMKDLAQDWKKHWEDRDSREVAAEQKNSFHNADEYPFPENKPAIAPPPNFDDDEELPF